MPGIERRAVERVRGTQDYWPPEAHALETIRRDLEACFTAFGYRRVEVPVLELAELHLRKSGLEIVSKLYAFEDQGGRQLCLRPELTASVVRAVVARPPARLPVKVFSSGPVFRYERPARGRYRQFMQAGVELIGAEGPLADAEVVALAMQALERLGVRDFRVTIGHVGLLGQLLARLGLTSRLRTFLLDSMEDVRRHGAAYVRQRLEELDPELFEPPASAAGTLPMDGSGSAAGVEQVVATVLEQVGAGAAGSLQFQRRRPDEVVARLSEKLHRRAYGEAVERALEFTERLGVVAGPAPEVLDRGAALLAEYALDEAPLHDLRQTLTLLESFGVGLERVTLDLGLSRGLQYYTGMVFEIDHAGLGSESQLCGGGRYDDLARALGARQPIPALGFAFGVERILLALQAEGKALGTAGEREAGGVFVVAASPAEQAYAARVAQALRAAGVPAYLEVSRRGLRASLAYADREGFARVAIVGEAEARAGTVRLHEMAGGEERLVPLSEAAALGNGRWVP